jgi:8-hydroxy-5-deazaflavin:NADPH oxidoreductase
MQIGIIGAGHIGSNCARQAARAGHTLLLSFSRDTAKLRTLADELGAAVGTPAEAVAFGEIVVLSVPWSVLPDVLAAAGDLHNKIVIDTTNQFGSGPMPASGQTAAAFNQARMPGARYTKCFNTLTAGFQAATATRQGDERVVQWICGDDPAANAAVARLVEDMGYVPVDLGGTATCAVMEAPRRHGAVYGEEYRLTDAMAVVEAVRAGRPIPPPPAYS